MLERGPRHTPVRPAPGAARPSVSPARTNPFPSASLPSFAGWRQLEHSQSARRTGSRRRATSGPGAPGARRRPPQRVARSNEPLSLGLCAQFRGVEAGGKRRANRILSLEDDVVDFAPAFDEIAANADAAWLALQRGCGGVAGGREAVAALGELGVPRGARLLRDLVPGAGLARANPTPATTTTTPGTKTTPSTAAAARSSWLPPTSRATAAAPSSAPRACTARTSPSSAPRATRRRTTASGRGRRRGATTRSCKHRVC